MKRKSIREAVLDKVKKGEVRMRSKYYFILRAILIALGIVVISAVALYLTSFVFFAFERAGLGFLPAFGFPGMRLLIFNLPWVLIVIVLLFIFLLELFVSRFKLAYRKPLLYSSLLIIAFVAVTGFIIKQTPLHGHFYRQVQEGHLPLARPLYKGMGMTHQPDQVHTGQVLEITPRGFVLQKSDGEIIVISTSTNTKLPFFDVVEVGDMVLVIGDEEGETISAIGIRELPDDFILERLPGSGRMMP